ncbi:MAG: sulfotransferase family protein [Thiotrichales bacterium]|nr:sulfotransferase family protein [Thiotrichales bacterium]
MLLDRDLIIIFTHIPKAAGTTLDRFFCVRSMLSNEPRIRMQGSLYGLGEYDAYQEFIRRPESDFASTRYLVGHLPYGIHEHLSRTPYYITLLRDPLARALSHYKFGIERKRWGTGDSLTDLYVAGVMPDNIQVRQIAGCRDKSERCDQQMLQRALENLHDKYGLVGVTGEFDAFLQKLIVLLEWPDILYTDFQTSTQELDEDAIKKMENEARPYNELDLLLYEEARKMQSRQTELRHPDKGSRQRSTESEVLLASAHIAYRNENYTLLSEAEARKVIKSVMDQGVKVKNFQ